jgi:3-oxoacyl-[acyl-carrier-protein] synthase-1
LREIRPAVDAAINRFGPERVAVVVGTSTSGLAEGEAALRCMSAAALARRLQLRPAGAGQPPRASWPPNWAQRPADVISTACSSGAKALASGRAAAASAGMADAVVAGGCDSLGRFTVAGFSALESVSAARCNPMSRNRRGINLGEGAALFLMTREPEAPVRLAGWGESSDAHHMSAPDPTGARRDARHAAALQRAGLAPGAVDYLNLHGTATPHNDAMESLAVAEVLGTQVPASSTKPLTGHTLGASGAIEAALCWMTLADNPEQRLLPPTGGTARRPGPGCRCAWWRPVKAWAARRAMC